MWICSSAVWNNTFVDNQSSLSQLVAKIICSSVENLFFAWSIPESSRLYAVSSTENRLFSYVDALVIGSLHTFAQTLANIIHFAGDTVMHSDQSKVTSALPIVLDSHFIARQ